MKTSFLFPLVLLIVSVLTFTPAVSSYSQDKPLGNFRPPLEEKVLEWKGYYGDFKDPKVMVIKDQNIWDGIYRIITGGAVRLTIDFSRYMVIAIFMGEKRTGGYRVDILRTEEMDGVEVVEYKGGRETKSLTKVKGKVFVVNMKKSPLARSLL